MSTSVVNRILLRLSLCGALGLAASVTMVTAPLAQAHASQPVIHMVRVEAHNNADVSKAWFEMPTTIPTGLVEFTFTNQGTVSHEAQFFRITDPNFTEAMLVAALLSSGPPPAGPPPFVTAGGAGSIEPGQTQKVIDFMQPGHYVVVCFDSGGDGGTPHLLRGMHMSFYAVAGTRAVVDPDDATDGHVNSNGVITLKDFQILLPRDITEHEAQTFKVVNIGGQAHQMQLLRVPTGTTRATILACVSSQSPSPACGQLMAAAKDAGGLDAIEPHTSGWVELRLAPGTYAAVCFVPNSNPGPTQGVPHAALGMITVFVVK